MDLSFTAEEENFREEVRAFVAARYPQHLHKKAAAGMPYEREDYVSWMQILAEKGWLAWSWAENEGGPGWSLTQRHIFRDELENAGTIPIFSMGVAMCGPVIQRFGTSEQKARFLPPILRAESWWCQGFSEPGAGSDLASLRTRADRVTGEDGRGYYRVNGQKIWTTLAQHADWGFFLVRTDPTAKKHEGISFLLIDMAVPGITVRPIETLGGEIEVNEIWLEDVMVPVENLIHDENKGWECALYLLQHERLNIAEVSRSKRRLQKLRQLASQQRGEDGVTVVMNAAFRRKIAQLEVELLALEYSNLRALAAVGQGRDPGPLMSMLKTRGSQIAQLATELALEVAGPYGFVDQAASPPTGTNSPAGPPGARRVADMYLNQRKASIYGGSNEIQLSIIAKAALGL